MTGRRFGIGNESVRKSVCKAAIQLESATPPKGRDHESILKRRHTAIAGDGATATEPKGATSRSRPRLFPRRIVLRGRFRWISLRQALVHSGRIVTRLLCQTAGHLFRCCHLSRYAARPLQQEAYGLIQLSVQDETNYGMLWLTINSWSLPWRDRDCWT